METYDVVIVGYGPTGMMLAALLARDGHSTLVVERYEGLYNLPRAATFDDEVTRTFQKLGIIDEILKGTVAETAYEWVNGDGQILMEISYDNPATSGWPAMQMMYQPDVEKTLDAHCKSQANITVQQGVTAVAMASDEAGVDLTVRDHDGSERQVRGRFLVGADGGMGFVREALGIGTSSYGFEEDWLVCDFSKKHDLEDVPDFRQVCDPEQPISIVRIGPRHHRFSFMLNDGETREQAIRSERVWERVSDYVSPDDVDLVRVANYIFRSRVADTWRAGRVFLAGDAAHEMPPFLGQGMCSGIRDAHNLAWKFHAILGGHATEAILDSYQPEREPHVRAITEIAIQLGRVLTIRDPKLAKERDDGLLVKRAANQVPEKVAFPPIASDLVLPSPGAGSLFIQGTVSQNGRTGRFDDLIGYGPCLLARSARDLDTVAQDRLSAFAEIGGLVVALGDRDTQVSDDQGLYAAWFERHEADAVLVRPDWYVFGTATGDNGAATLIDEFTTRLRMSPVLGEQRS